MKIKMDELIKTIADALDIVEGELIGSTTNHGKRIAILSYSIGRYFNLNNDSLISLTTCALLHDNALTEYILSEKSNLEAEFNTKQHCIIGQRNVDALGLKGAANKFILYHHERADGSGAFGKKEGEYPLEAEIIALADNIDVRYPLQNIEIKDLPLLQKHIENESGIIATTRVSTAMKSILTEEMLLSLRDSVIVETSHNIIPTWALDIEDLSVMKLAEFIACIIDYKSEFTKKHSTEIAKKILIMSDFYKFDPATKSKAYLAASLHDIGKLKTPLEILEKADSLSEPEFTIIKKHVLYTYEMLMDIEGFEDICQWASNHHEKLDGSGYPFGKKAEDIDFISRLMACIDIYQAVSEKRPYHPKRNHIKTMKILASMSEKGLIDSQIVKDIDLVMGKL